MTRKYPYLKNCKFCGDMVTPNEKKWWEYLGFCSLGCWAQFTEKRINKLEKPKTSQKE